jgi:hypothetical protein
MSSFLSADVPTITELRFAELKGEGGGRAERGDCDPVGEMDGTLTPRMCRDPTPEPLRGGVEGSGLDRSELEAFVVYAESIGDAPPVDDECLRPENPPQLLWSSNVLVLEELEEAVVESDDGNEYADPLLMEDAKDGETCRLWGEVGG